MQSLSESVIESATLSWFSGLGYATLFGPAIAPGELLAERARLDEGFLPNRLRSALAKLNPHLPPEAVEEAFRKVTVAASPHLVVNNRAFHMMLVEGVDVEYTREGRRIGDKARLADFEEPEANDFLVVNQFTMLEQSRNRRADLVVFLNGLPVGVIELKNPADENATIWSAYQQLQTYKQEIPSLFTFNEVLVVSDGLEARIGTLTSPQERFMPWRTIEGEKVAPVSFPQLQVLMHGVFEKRRFLDLIRHFVIFEDEGKGGVAKKLAGYHQFHAVNRALEATLEATRPSGDQRCGVVWHTQGSGKSLTMVFYAGKLILAPELENPTLVVLTDRNDLDGQLYGTFSRCKEILRQAPVQADSRAQLRELLQVASGGVVFTTIQKFFPEGKGDTMPLLSGRRNIVVIADEAHRSQYDFIDGFARHLRDALPGASFIGFTGTPVELTDRSTRAVFGDTISIYDIQQAVEDGATVPIYYESRLAQLVLDETERPKLDADFEELTEGEEAEHKERLRTKWAALEAVVGADGRIHQVATDLVRHFDERQEGMPGKALVVCMSRRICIEIYKAIVALRPAWHDDDDREGAVKVVMTGSASDPPDWQPHIRDRRRREALAGRLKDEADPLRIVLVRDMWLTGFDVPCLHTMYLDKPMQGHGLMQAIARVNRVFKDKPGGLVVDYLGLADPLKNAMATYTQSGGRGKTTLDQNEAVAVMMRWHEVCVDIFFGFDWTSWRTGKPAERLSLLPRAMEHILSIKGRDGEEDGRSRFLGAVANLSKAFALAVPHPETFRIRDDVGFFQATRAGLIKTTGGDGKPPGLLDEAIRQLLSRAIGSEGVVDILKEMGLKRPDLSILSEEFLAEVQQIPEKNLAVEMLRKLLNDEIRSRGRKNLILGRSFAEMLEKTLIRYRNKSIETVEVIQELIRLAKELKEAEKRGVKLGLNEDELAFYDALETNDSAVAVLGDQNLCLIARELVESIRRNVTIDWTLKDSIRAKLRIKVKQILRNHGYPPDKQEKATQTVLQQAELIAANWAA